MQQVYGADNNILIIGLSLIMLIVLLLVATWYLSYSPRSRKTGYVFPFSPYGLERAHSGQPRIERLQEHDYGGPGMFKDKLQKRGWKISWA